MVNYGQLCPEVIKMVRNFIMRWLGGGWSGLMRANQGIQGWSGANVTVAAGCH